MAHVVFELGALAPRAAVVTIDDPERRNALTLRIERVAITSVLRNRGANGPDGRAPACSRTAVGPTERMQVRNWARARSRAFLVPATLRPTWWAMTRSVASTTPGLKTSIWRGGA
jgi:hypothetical protein